MTFSFSPVFLRNQCARIQLLLNAESALKNPGKAVVNGLFQFKDSRCLLCDWTTMSYEHECQQQPYAGKIVI